MFRKPTLLEMALKKDTFFHVSSLGNSVLPTEIVSCFHAHHVVVLTSEEDFLDPKKLSLLQKHAPNWHRDVMYPLFGLYKPKGVVRLAKTEFVISSYKDHRLHVAHEAMIDENNIVASDYSKAGEAKLVLWLNIPLFDGGYLMHRRGKVYGREKGELLVFGCPVLPLWIENRSDASEPD